MKIEMGQTLLRTKRLLLSVCCLFVALAGFSQQNKLTEKVKLNISQSTLSKVLDALDRQSGYSFSYIKEDFDSITVRNYNVDNITLSEALNLLKKTAGIDYTVNDSSVLFRKAVNTQKGPGKITGRIIDEQNGQPIAGVTIRIGNKGAMTGIDGAFSVSLLKGSYTARVSYVGYGTKEVSEIEIKDNQVFDLNIALKREKGQLAVVVVKASARSESINALYSRQKKNTAISDGISAEQISRTPDNNTAQVLKRVSGLQISNEKYVVVRGLSDRYNNVLLNGNQLPSSEPNRRDFAFDMIPSGLIDNIVVNKTATPDLPGEFTGGLVQVNTKDIPNTNFTTISIGAGINSQSTGKDFIGGQRQAANYFGVANGYQKNPEGITFGQYNVLASKIEEKSATAAEKDQVARFLGKIPDNWAMRRYTAQPIQNYSLTAGRNIPIGENKLGIVGAITYRNEQTADIDDQYSPTVFDYKGTEYAFTTLLGGSLNLGYSFGKNKLTLKNTYNRRLTDKLYQFKGTDIINNYTPVSAYSGQTLINELFQTSLSGEHALGKKGIKLDYNGAVSTLARDQPNSRVMSMRGTPNVGEHSSAAEYYSYNFVDFQPEMGSTFYSGLKEKRYAYQANLQIPFTLLQLSQSFKTGYQGSYRKADYWAESYRIRNTPDSIGENFAGYAYTDVYNNTNFSNQRLYLLSYIGLGQAAANGLATGYNGSQRLDAFYGMLDLKPFGKLRLVGGLRVEQNMQRVFTKTLGVATDPDELRPIVDSLISISKTDWLPSLNAIYALTNRMNIRAAYYHTVARPDLRELSYFEYFDFDVFRAISGSNLLPTQIKNYDLRYEFYPSPDEIISVSGFYKKFTNPIELTIEPTSAKPFLKYKNLLSAEDIGFEIDFRKSLNFLSRSAGFWKRVYVSGSFTWLDASVDLGPGSAVDDQGNPVASKRDRPLYGQSPYIINGGINYTGKQVGFNVVYNRYGKRIVTASAYTSEDEYENPRDMVDLQLSYKFLKDQQAELRFNISNLLNQELLYYKNQYGPGHPVYAERDPSVERYPGDGSQALPAGQLDPKGTAYHQNYDVITQRRKNGTNYTLNVIYRF